MTDDQDKTTPTEEPDKPEPATSPPDTTPPSAPEPVEPEQTSVAPPEAEVASTQETPVDARSDAPLPRADRRFLVATAVAALLGVIAVLLALMVFAPRIAPLKLGATSLAARAQEDEEILDVARRFSRNFLNHDYRSMDDFVDRVSADLTGSFREEFQQVNEFSESAFVKSKVVSKGKVKGAVLLYHEGSDARVQILAERTTSNVNLKTPRSEDKILNVFLVKTSDGWKVDNVGEPEQQGAAPAPTG